MVSSPSIALIDADLWVYDAGFASERRDEEGEKEILPFSYAKNIIDMRLEYIMDTLKCAEYEFYLTGKGNFRYDKATRLPYKGNRKDNTKPYHLENITNYLQFAYGATVIDGMEADDMLAIRQTQLGDSSVIVSRDKDLRMVKGWHYGYGVGNQKEQDLEYIDEVGYLILLEGKRPKLKGGGMKWFYAQCMMGDKTDNIPGLPRTGDIAAFKTLNECESVEEMHKKVLALYKEKFEEDGEAFFNEAATLLWMCLEQKPDGTPVTWEDLC